MPRYFIEFSYDGSNYHGIQKQPNSSTIQEILETNISKYSGSNINLTLAGRTDAGVHAKQMFAHFDMDHDFDKSNFCRSLNMMIPKDICLECLSLVNKWLAVESLHNISRPVFLVTGMCSHVLK